MQGMLDSITTKSCIHALCYPSWFYIHWNTDFLQTFNECSPDFKKGNMELVVTLA